MRYYAKLIDHKKVEHNLFSRKISHFCRVYKNGREEQTEWEFDPTKVTKQPINYGKSPENLYLIRDDESKEMGFIAKKIYEGEMKEQSFLKAYHVDRYTKNIEKLHDTWKTQYEKAAEKGFQGGWSIYSPNSKNGKYSTYKKWIKDKPTFHHFTLNLSVEFFRDIGVSFDKVQKYWNAARGEESDTWGMTITPENVAEVKKYLLDPAVDFVKGHYRRLDGARINKLNKKFGADVVKEKLSYHNQFEENLIGATLHLDEYNPHVEFLMSSVTNTLRSIKDSEGKGVITEVWETSTPFKGYDKTQSYTPGSRQAAIQDWPKFMNQKFEKFQFITPDYTNPSDNNLATFKREFEKQNRVYLKRDPIEIKKMLEDNKKALSTRTKLKSQVDKLHVTAAKEKELIINNLKKTFLKLLNQYEAAAEQYKIQLLEAKTYPVDVIESAFDLANTEFIKQKKSPKTTKQDKFMEIEDVE